MAVEFPRKLKNIVDSAIHDSRAELRFALGMVADVIVEAFDSDLQATAVDRRSVSEAMEIARAAARIVDAGHLIESCLFGGRGERCFRELELPHNRNPDVLSSFLERGVRRAVENYPFVYVVWQCNPERYLHIGNGQYEPGAARCLDLATPGLLAALQQGSLMTLLVPAPMTTTAAVDIEAAIRSVLDCQKAPFDLAADPARVPGAPGAAHLAELGRLLGELAAKLGGARPVVSELAG